MNFVARFSLSLSLLALLPTSLSARPPVPIKHPAPGQRLAFDTRKFMPVSEVRPGMIGYALTVFKGTTITKYHIKVLGILSKFNEGKDYILFRVLDGPPITRQLNVAHGMSGSPIYINGRLVGAISMGIPGTLFAKDPVALATPIEDMLDSWNPDLPAKLPEVGAGSASSDANTLSHLSGLESRYPLSAFQPIAMPVSVSGMSPQGVARLSAALAPYHFDVMAGSNGGGVDANNPLARGAKLVPGSAVGVSLVTGDMSIAATGTVTFRDGNRVLLFGHPFTNFGPIDAAMSTAYVVDIFPSYQDSVILGSPIKTIGRIFQDRPFSVGGLIGSMPHMIPVTIDINDLSLKTRKTYHVQVINHPLLTGQFINQVADEAILEVHGQPGDSMARVTMDADVEQVGHVIRTNTFYDALSIDQTAIGDLNSLTQLLSSNPFYPLALKSLKMSVTIQEKHDTAEIDHLFLRQSKFAPGDTVQVGVVLKPYKHDLVTETIPVKIPMGTPNGALALTVKGGGTDSGGGISFGGITLLRPSDPLPPSPNITQLIKSFVEKPRNNDLTARLILSTTAININGQKLPSLPPTLGTALAQTNTSLLTGEHDEVRVNHPTSYVVSGSQNLIITVAKKTSVQSDAPAATPAPADTPAPPPSASAAAPDADDGDGDDSQHVVSSVGTLSADASAYLDNYAQGVPAPTPTMPAPSAPPKRSTSPVPSKTAPSADTPAPDAVPKPASTPAVKTVGRLASVWHQNSLADFSAGTQQNVTVTSLGDVRLSQSLHLLADSSDTYLWALLPGAAGQVFAGTGNHGIVYQISADGKLAPFFKTGELEVTSLAQDKDGNLYAGTAPNGIVFKIGPNGQGAKFFTATEKYVTALAYDDVHKTLYVATGGGTGCVYAVSIQGASPMKPLFTSPETHLLSLTIDKDGNVYAGSAPDGIVYKITPAGVSSVLYDATEPDIASLATDAQGNVYAGTLPKGTIYKIAPDGNSKVLYDRATDAVRGLAVDTANNLYACAGNTVYRITPDETVQSFVASSDQQFLSLAVAPGTGQVYAGTGTIASVYTIAPEAGTTGLSGTFQSAVHDAGRHARWGTLSWTADTPSGTHVMLQTRSGDVERPDASWSDWSAPTSQSSGQPISSPPARYLQYMATLSHDPGSSAMPRLRTLSVYYLPRNQSPTIKLLKPADGDALAKSALIQWSASDPDHDTLTYDLAYSSDGGTTWKPITKKATPTSPTAVKAPTAPDTAKPTTTAPAPVTDQEVADKVAEMKADMDKHPELPPAVRAQILEQAPDVIRAALTRQRARAASGAGTSSSAGPAGSVKDTSFTWDTTEVPDGVYQIRVIASDKSSNPSDALTAKVVSGAFEIANAIPSLKAGTPSIGTGKTVTVRGTITTKLAFVKAVQYKVDGGDPAAAMADDGLFDSTQEAWTLVTVPLTSGSHTIEVQGVDMAGNTATQKVSVTVP